MTALVATGYGPPDVVQLCTVADLTAGPRDVVVRVHATPVTSGDARLRAGRFPPGMGLLGRLAFGVLAPRKKVLGVALAGVVEEVGAKVGELAPGDRVVGMTGMAMGAHAERCRLSVDHCVARIPDDVPFEHAATLPFGGLTAMTFLVDRARLQAGERMIVIGAAGAVGAACVQIGRILGVRVTGVCSARNADLVRRLGADDVLDYTATDVFESAERWDVVIDTIGQATLAQCRAIATPRGRIGLVAAGLWPMLARPWVHATSRQRVLVGPADESAEHLQSLIGWLADGKLTPVIDRLLPWQRAAEAHARVDTHHKTGSLVLTVG